MSLNNRVNILPPVALTPLSWVAREGSPAGVGTSALSLSTFPPAAPTAAPGECARSGVALQSAPECRTRLGPIPPRVAAVSQPQVTDPAALFSRKFTYYTPGVFHQTVSALDILAENLLS